MSKEKPTILLGIDEAGRGPILGPLVLAAVAIEAKNLPKLEELPLKDSKLLTPKQREDLYPKIIKVVKAYKILIINPSEIDEALESDTLNLNWLEAEKTAEIINELNPDDSFIDCPSNNIKAYTAYLKNIINNQKSNLICEHKADTTFKIVAAASILAKVTRDKEIANIQKEIPEKIGSGYLTDPITQEFLQKNHQDYGNIIRKSWITYKKLLEQKNQKALGEFTDN
jgi:ribonuclease HII